MGPSCAQGGLNHQKCSPGPRICLLRIFFKDKEKDLWWLNSKTFHGVGIRLGIRLINFIRAGEFLNSCFEEACLYF